MGTKKKNVMAWGWIWAGGKHPFGSWPLHLRAMFRAARAGKLVKARLAYEDDKGRYTLTVPGLAITRQINKANRSRRFELPHPDAPEICAGSGGHRG